MSHETTVREPEFCDVVPAAESQARALQAVIEQVRRDSQQAPDQYLDESTVPHGGE